MQDQLIRSIADRYNLPEPVAQDIAATVAERCALMANRYEPEGIFTMDQMSAVETIGAQIGAAIIQSFPVSDRAG